MSKLSVSVPDALVADLRGLAEGNVSAFVTTAIRHEVDRRHLFSFLDEMDQELGPVGDEEVAHFVDVLLETARAGRPSPRRRPAKRSTRRQAS